MQDKFILLIVRLVFICHPLQSHQTGPNLLYNVSWTIFGSQLPPTPSGWEGVRVPRAVIAVETDGRRSIEDGGGDGEGECLTMQLGVQPFNDIGPGQMAARQIVYLTGRGEV